VGRFLLMEFKNEPMEALEAWHKWYAENKIVASMEEPMATKDSRENLHDTSRAITDLLTAAEKVSSKKATEYFADTISEFLSDLSGQQLFDALLSAATDNYNYTKKEYEKAAQFLELINGKTKK
jgi:ubiquinone/menaquinone biosynthesis C-methylase UbiE